MLLHNHQELKFTMPSIVEKVKQLQLAVAKPGTTTLALPTKLNLTVILSWIQFSCSVVSDSLRPMDWSRPDFFPVHHQIPEFIQTHVHWVGDAIQPSHPLSSLSPPAFSLSQHQSLFKWISYSHQVAQVLEFQLQHQSLPMTTQDWSPLGWTGWISLQSKGLSGVFSNTTVQKHQFFGAQLSLWSNSHMHTWLPGKPQPWLDETLLAK